MKNIVVVTLFLFTSSFFGQELSDKEIIRKAIQFLKVAEKDVLSDKICLKVIPNQKEKVIILIPIISKRYAECGDDPCFDIDNNILIWNKTTKKIETKYTKKAEWTSDAMYLSELNIDTGLYYLNKSTRAFGIRYSYSGSSRVNPFGSNSINLYYLKNNQIIEVLNDFNLNNLNGESNGDCANGSYESSKSVFIINDKLTTKLNDITVKTKLKDYSMDEDCEKEIIKKESTKTSVLKFDEKQHKYVLKQ
ncbi:hypothetical protein [Flavobacterium sp.]|uniref:hypothetical protein n=1 Tax=Flavobacterium sp. TaxID=239 RepID=UPI00286A9CF5|nr:hypothetical protein [Flavobacterium sp.]